MDAKELDRNIRGLLYVCSQVIDNNHPMRNSLDLYIQVYNRTPNLSHINFILPLLPLVTEDDSWLLNEVEIHYGKGKEIADKIKVKIPISEAYKKALQLESEVRANLAVIPAELHNRIPELVYPTLIKLYLYRIFKLIDTSNTKYDKVINECNAKLSNGFNLDSIISNPENAITTVLSNQNAMNVIQQISNQLKSDEFKSVINSFIKSIEDNKVIKDIITNTLSDIKSNNVGK